MQLAFAPVNDFSHQHTESKPIPSLSIIVPVYNEQQVLPLFHQTLLEVIAEMPEERVEILYINDGSQDKSWSIIKSLTAPNCQLQCINLSRNFGKEAAMTAGFDYSNGEYVTVLDADLQIPQKLLPQMLQAVRQGGMDIVNMKRQSRADESFFKTFSAKCFYKLFGALTDVPMEQNVGDFRLLSRRVVNHIKQLPEKNRYMKGIMSWPGFNSTTLFFDRPGRAAGETKWSTLQLIKLALSGITSFSVKPLRLATWAGALISTSAFIYGIWILTKTILFGDPVAGFPTMVLLQLILGGINLLAIGFVGEYIAQIYTEAKGRPIYLVMDAEHTESQTQ